MQVAFLSNGVNWLLTAKISFYNISICLNVIKIDIFTFDGSKIGKLSPNIGKPYSFSSDISDKAQ